MEIKNGLVVSDKPDTNKSTRIPHNFFFSPYCSMNAQAYTITEYSILSKQE